MVNKTNVKSGFVTSLKALLLSLVVCGFIIAAVGYNPIQAYYYLGVGAFGSFREISNTLANSIPLIFTGLSVAVASRAGLLNIGAEGQLYIGAMCGTVCALYAPISNHLMMIVAVLISSMVGGMLWGAVPGVLKASLGTNEVIVSIMLNYTATLLTTFLVVGPVKERGSTVNQSAMIGGNAQLTKLVPRTQLTTALILAIVCCGIVWYLFEHTIVGFKLSAVGDNPGAARANGIIPSKYIVLAMMLSGAIASLAGVTEVVGKYYRFRENFSVGLGFTGIAVAVLAQNNPVGIISTAILFGGLSTGSLYMSRITGISGNMANVIQSIIILFVAAPRLMQWVDKKRRQAK